MIFGISRLWREKPPRLKEYDAKDRGHYRTRWRERWWQYWRPVKPPKDKAKRLIKNRRQSRVFFKDEKE